MNTNNTNPHADQKNSNPIGKTIDGVLKRAEQDGNAQVRLVELMFNQEVTFSEIAIRNAFRSEERGKRAEFLNKHLCELSADFAAMTRKEELWKERESSFRKDNIKEAIDIDANSKAMKAARALFERAVISVYGLRALRSPVVDDEGIPKKDDKGNPILRATVQKVMIVPNGRGMKIKMYDDEFGDTKVVTWSAADALRNGQRLLDQAKPKKKDEKASKDAPKNTDIVTVRTQTFDTAAKYLNGLPSLDKLSEGEHKALDSLLISLIRQQFVVDGILSVKELKEYLAENKASDIKIVA